MKRKDFLKGLGIAGVGTMIPIRKTNAAVKAISQASLPANTCILIPSETAGPYPFDLSNNPAMFRQDITEGNAGIPMNLTLTVVNINDNCNPIPNVRVDIWHCDKDGYYSEFNVSSWLGPQNHVGDTFFRGIQITDLNGQVQFTTIYPGWYPGRAVHIHFQVFLNSVLTATSQLCFPDALNTQVNNLPPYSAHGQNPTTNSNDGVFSDMNNTQYQIAATAPNASGGYDASLTIGLNVPISGVINLEPETGGQFKLRQNFPNPVKTNTVIPFTLKNSSRVKIEIFDVTGKKQIELINQNLDSGEHTIPLDLEKHALGNGNYIYQLTVENEKGVFRQCKVLTVE
jgi:protocatechuate 3,4-dioxygenase beta subunit